MIGKVMNKRRDGLSSFFALVNYTALGIKGGKVIEKIEAAGCYNLLGVDTAIAEMKACAIQNTRCHDPAFHFMLSWREGEAPTLEQVKASVQHALKRLGLEECQAVWGLHNDTECLHVHVAVNRIHPETYRAIDPAHGWTKNELEKACRELELAQGWAIEESGKFTVDNGKVVWKSEAKERTAKRDRRISQTARDFETRIGEKSAERIAIELAAPIIQAATSWQELHRQLAAIGIAYHRKGSGAVLQIGDEFVKASSAHRNAAIGCLTKRLGEFLPPFEDLVIPPREPQPVTPMPEGWIDYAKTRRKRKITKRLAREKLNSSLKAQFRELKAAQFTERKNFYAQGWKGRGTAMRAERSLLAAMHAAQLAAIREHQKMARAEFGQRWRRFSTFREVLIGFRDAPEKGQAVHDELRYSTKQASLHGPNGVATLTDIRGYRGHARGRFVAYSSTAAPTVSSFIDYGRKIHVHQQQDASTILAALQLAAQKWNGQVTLGGPDAYKAVAIRLALAQGIKVTNPELQPLIQQERAYLEQLGQSHSTPLPSHAQQRKTAPKADPIPSPGDSNPSSYF